MNVLTLEGLQIKCPECEGKGFYPNDMECALCRGRTTTTFDNAILFKSLRLPLDENGRLKMPPPADKKRSYD